MKIWFQRNYKAIIVSAFLIPIITVAIVSISHVTRWYGISNPNVWAIYLSIGIEIAALSSLAAISVKMGKKVYFPFIIVTFIQFIGNVFFSYSYIDITSTMFKSWVELMSPVLNTIGVDPTDIAGHKRFLAFFAGGMLPVISLSFLHMLIKFTENEDEKELTKPVVEVPVNEPNVQEDEPISQEVEQEVPAKDIVSEVSRVRLTEEDLTALERMLNKKTEKPIPSPSQIIKDQSEEFVGLRPDQMFSDEERSEIMDENPYTVLPVAPVVEEEPVDLTPVSVVEEEPVDLTPVSVVEEEPVDLSEPPIEIYNEIKPEIFDTQILYDPEEIKKK